MSIQRLEPEEVHRLLQSGEGYVYLDVRTEEEFREGHVPEAINVPVMLRSAAGGGMVPNPEFVHEVEKRVDPTSKIVTGCLRGGRSLRAAGLLLEQGFEHVVDMRGGFDGELDRAGNVIYAGWGRRGLPVHRPGGS